MFKFYADMLPMLPRILFDAANRWFTLLGLLVSILLVINGEWAETVENVSSWLALIPIGLLLVWGFLRANYLAIEDATKKAALLPIKEQEIELRKQQNLDLQKKLTVSQEQYEVFKDFSTEQKGSGF